MQTLRFCSVRACSVCAMSTAGNADRRVSLVQTLAAWKVEICWEWHWKPSNSPASGGWAVPQQDRGAEVLALLFGIFKSFKLFFFPLEILSKCIYLKENLKCAILQMLGSLFSSFCCGRSVNVSDCSYRLLSRWSLSFSVSSPVWYVLICFSPNFLLFAALLFAPVSL